MTETTEITIQIPFPTVSEAVIAYDVLRLDSQPKQQMVSSEMSVEGNILRVQFIGDYLKSSRVAVTSFFQMLALVISLIDEFGAQAQSSAEEPT